MDCDSGDADHRLDTTDTQNTSAGSETISIKYMGCDSGDSDLRLDTTDLRNVSSGSEKTVSAKYMGCDLDENDGPKRRANFNWFDTVCIAVSTISYLADMIADIFMAIQYYREELYWYSALTIVFVAIPALTMSGLSARWYIKDQKNPNLPPISKWRWAFRIICVVLLISPVARYFDALMYGLESRRAKKHKDLTRSAQFYANMAYEDADATFLRLFECFMESAPQLVLQLYIMAKGDFKFGDPGDTRLIVLQTISVLTAAISLAWALTSYNRSLRYAQVDKENISFPGTICLFTAHIFNISARVLALSLFAHNFTWCIWPVCVSHWILMAIWVWLQETGACSTKTEEFFFCLVLAVIHIFTFFNVKPDSTRCRYIFYYLVCFVENTTLISFWLVKEGSKPVASDDPSTEIRGWYYYPAMPCQLACFFLGLILLTLYYKVLHPNIVTDGTSTRVEICTKDVICMSGVDSEGKQDRASSPSRLGRLDQVKQVIEVDKVESNID